VSDELDAACSGHAVLPTSIVDNVLRINFILCATVGTLFSSIFYIVVSSVCFKLQLLGTTRTINTLSILWREKKTIYLYFKERL